MIHADSSGTRGTSVHARNIYSFMFLKLTANMIACTTQMTPTLGILSFRRSGGLRPLTRAANEPTETLRS